MRKVITIIIPVLICFLVGFLGAQSQTESLMSWYPTLHKSPLTPPNIIFPIVWSILYLCMGVSIGLILISKAEDKQQLTILFCVQLMFNYLWSFFFFQMKNPLYAFIDLIMLGICIIAYAIYSYKRHKISSILFWPYIVWILFAGYLNLYVLMHN